MNSCLFAIRHDMQYITITPSELWSTLPPPSTGSKEAQQQVLKGFWKKG